MNTEQCAMCGKPLDVADATTCYIGEDCLCWHCYQGEMRAMELSNALREEECCA